MVKWHCKKSAFPHKKQDYRTNLDGSVTQIDLSLKPFLLEGLEVAKVHSVKAPVWDRFIEPNWVIQLGVSEKLGHPHPKNGACLKRSLLFHPLIFRFHV